MKTILIVEDDKSINQGIKLALEQDGYIILQAHNICDAKKSVDKENIDLIILDVILPDGSGFDFCKYIRKLYDIPIIFLTACDMEVDIFTGLEMGGDDYITKPFSLMILRAKIKSVLRRVYKEDLDKIVKVGDLDINFKCMEVKKCNTKINLSKTEFRLLRLFIENKGQIMTRDQLVDNIWNDESEFVDENALTVTVRRLRMKIEDDKSNPSYIKTVYGMGYIWTGGILNEQ